MLRREFVTGAFSILSSTVIAQRLKVWRIGHILGAEGPERRQFQVLTTVALEKRLAELGYVAGQNVAIEHHYHTLGTAGEAALQAVAARNDVLIVWSAARAVVVKKVAPDTPTVFLSVGDPVAIGLVQSLSHPGGNMTGVTFEGAMDAYGKRLSFLKEMVPELTRVAVLRAANDPNIVPAMASLTPAAERLHVVLQPIEFTSEVDLEPAFSRAVSQGSQALLVLAGALTSLAGKQIAALALAHELPSSGPFRETVQDGGLVSYGPDFEEMARQGALYLDRIMRGARPAELPVELPKRYETYLNLRTARTLGITVPTTLLATADVVIE